MRQEIRDAAERLTASIRPFGKVIVAYSGGVDSALVASAARRALGDGAIAVTVLSPTLPSWEVRDAGKIAETLDVLHEYVRLDELDDPDFRSNTPDRCYHCKKRRIQLLEPLARERGATRILDGSNLDDLGDDRPGYRAVLESPMTMCPLIEARMTKAMVRELSREWEIPGATRPAAACLASRIPHGTPLTGELLCRVERAEGILRDALPPESRVRVRTTGDDARVEIDPADFPSLLDETTRLTVLSGLKEAGFSRILLDLAGYVRGGANELPGRQTWKHPDYH